MKRKSTRVLLIVFAIVVLLLAPLIFKERGRQPLVGPDLSEMEYTEIYFDNEQANLKLAGMLFVPDGAGPFPTAVIIHGSGPSRRNSTWYLSVTRHLIQNGIAVLLPDKRGCEESGGEWIGANFEELATDTSSAINHVRRQEAFIPSSIGIIGMSQGGWIAPVVAADSGGIDFIVSMSGATVTAAEQLEHEEIYNIGHYTYGFLAELFAPITSAKILEMDHIKAYAGFDPIPYWKRTHTPVFFAFGENDENVPVEASIQRLNENGLSHHKIEVYPDGGHGIVDSRSNAVSDKYLNDLVEFIKTSDR